MYIVVMKGGLMRRVTIILDDENEEQIELLRTKWQEVIGKLTMSATIRLALRLAVTIPKRELVEEIPCQIIDKQL